MPCSQCGSELTGRRTKYCSRSCAGKADYLRNAQAYKDRARAALPRRKEADPDGLRAYNRERARRLYWSDPDKARAKRRAEYWKNPQARREASRAYYWKNPEPYRLRALARIAKDLDGHRAIQRQRYYATDPDTRYLRSLVSRLRRREKIKAYEAANIERRRIAVIIRRQRLAQNGGSFSAAEWQALREAYGNRCLACGLEKPLTPDHVIPLVLGGRSDIENIQPLCAT